MNRPAASTTIPPIWRLPARAAWTILALSCVALFLLGTIQTIREPLPSCTPAGSGCTAILISAEDAAIAARLGLPLRLPALAASLLARLTLGVVGLVIFWRRSDDWMALMLSGALLSVLLEGIHLTRPGLALLQGVLFGVGTALFLPLPFVFPNGRFTPTWIRLPALALTAAFVFVVVVLFNHPLYATASAILVVAWSLLAFGAMPYRYLRLATPVERQQIKWVLLGIGAVLISGTYYAALSVLLPPTAPSPMRVYALLLNGLLYVACYSFFAGTLLLAMLRYRLWDVDLLIRRTLQYTLLTGLLALVYFGAVVLLQSILTPLTGQANTPLITVLSTLGIAALFNPLRQRLQAFIDGRFYRTKVDAGQALARFAQTARDEVELAQLTAGLLAAVSDTLQPAHLSLWIKPAAAVAPTGAQKRATRG